jgi:voltage-gated potassium channel
MGEADGMGAALKRSGAKITVFFGVVLVIVVVMGTIMYVIEPPEAGFTSIPRSIYWAIVTLTTVGYGDIAPQTPLGQFFASIIMILGYSIIAVPTGMISVELSKTSLNTQYCSACSFDNHEDDAIFCKKCGEELNPVVE